MARVNPSLANEQAQYNPVHRVTGLFDSHDAVTAALCDLEEAGFGREDIDILAGAEGEHVLDPSGQASTTGHWYRKLEDWVSDTSKFQELASATLNAGGFVVAARPGEEALKGRAMEILAQHGARDVKYWATWYVEQGHEDEPRQNLKRDDQ
ncbi:hypothetical protein LuPra_04578 [Luteitalea pratensis]|uniref:General stress protein 17M-like domain-containing protein n=1 Tax=Luteitalea pratensis TaxID=1855912 RepID=A0A143PT51_LUTPR|nr:hypothetical protein [Luteitalea pratensis]AMY11328.1 hypothetical protein LuPra_04578 [Luteitalea pratensis]